MQQRYTRTTAGGLLLFLAIGTFAQDYDLDWHTVDCGGETFSTGGAYELSGTIGQPDAGMLSGGEFQLSGGFWFPIPPGDCNNTGGVDLLDYDDFDECLFGPGGGFQPECRCFDFDDDGDVDLVDYAVFQAAFTGS